MTEFKRGMITGALIALGVMLVASGAYLLGRDVQARETRHAECGK